MEVKNNSSTKVKKNTRVVRNVVLKAFLLFVMVNLLFAATYPLPNFGRISAYNKIFPGRLRLPYGENPDLSFNLSLYNLEAMFASHELSAGPKPEDEFRVILIGDSSTWGFLLPNEETLSGYLNLRNITVPDGRHLRAYNLGYPVMSLTKDLLFLTYAKEFDPDMIVWPLTLESFPSDKQLFPPVLQNNPEPVRELIQLYDLDLDINDPSFVNLSTWEKTIVGARRQLADLIRLQLFGVMWAATSVDQYFPENFEPPIKDLPDDDSFHELAPPNLSKDDLALDSLTAGIEAAGETPVLIINEPMYVSYGENSHIRYNFFYPRWAYDDYRRLMSEYSQAYNWDYLDLWNAIPNTEFTNSAVHLSPQGTQQYSNFVSAAILEILNQKHLSP